MNIPYDWERLVEPTPRELQRLDSRVAEILRLWAQDATSKEFKLPYLEELADYAYIDLLNQASSFQKKFGRKPSTQEFNEFRIEAIKQNMPAWSERYSEKYYREVFREIASILGKLLAQARARKIEKQEKRTLLQRQKTLEVKERECKLARERKIKGEQDAQDVLEHGIFHGELLLPSIRAKNPVKTRRGTRHWIRRPHRETIPLDDQLGGIIDQVDNEIFLRQTKKHK